MERSIFFPLFEDVLGEDNSSLASSFLKISHWGKQQEK